MNKKLLKFVCLLGAFGMFACGVEPRNTVTLQIAGSDSEFELSNTVCEAGFPYAGGNSPVSCYGRFRNTGAISDGISFDIFDAFFIQENLGQDIGFHTSTIIPRVTLDGVERGFFDGYARFSEISNFSGGRVCFQFLIFLSDSTMQGNFCDNIAVGANF